VLTPTRKMSVLEKLAEDKRYGDYARAADKSIKQNRKAQTRVRNLPSIEKVGPWNSRGSLKRKLQRSGQKRIRRKADKAYVHARQAVNTARSIPKARRSHNWKITPDPRKSDGGGTLRQRRAEAGSPVGPGYKLHKDKNPGKWKRHVGRGTAGQRLAEGNFKPTEAMGLIGRTTASKAYSPWKKLQGEYAGAKSTAKSTVRRDAEVRAHFGAGPRSKKKSSPTTGGGWFSRLTKRKDALGSLGASLAPNS